jgi:kumamolisin
MDMRSVASWTLPDLCAAYDWPKQNAPDGGVIAIVELGGGWTHGDVAKFFADAKLPAPNIVDISVDGTTNSQCNPRNDADGEVALDIQVAGAAYAVATGKAANIRVYWAQDIAKAVAAATADGCDVCSISWGADEASWGAAAGDAMEQTAAAATNAGMVVFAASGDNDSSDGGPGRANVDLPASAPHVIGCGGTHKPHTGEETVWNNDPRRTTGEGTGGGYSTLFPMPSWQAGALQAAWCRTWRGTPIRTPVMRSSYMTPRRSSAAPAPWRRSTPGFSRHSGRSSASSHRNCT